MAEERPPPQQIQAYGGGAFRVSGGERFEGSVLIYADRTAAWSASCIDDISSENIATARL